MIGFGGKSINAFGKLQIPVSFGEGSNFQTEDITFDVVDMSYPYNAIFRRRVLNKFSVAPHHGYLCMKMPSPRGVISVLGDQQMARRIEVGYTLGCHNIHVVTKSLLKPQEVESLLHVQKIPRAKPEGKTKKVMLC